MATESVVVTRAFKFKNKPVAEGDKLEMPRTIARFWKRAKFVEEATKQKPRVAKAGVVHSENWESEPTENEDMAKKKATGTYSNRAMKAQDISKASVKTGKRKYQRRDMKAKK